MELHVPYPRSHTLGKTICYVIRTLKDGGGPHRRELSLLSKNQQESEPPWGRTSPAPVELSDDGSLS